MKLHGYCRIEIGTKFSNQCRIQHIFRVLFGSMQPRELFTKQGSQTTVATKSHPGTRYESLVGPSCGSATESTIFWLNETETPQDSKDRCCWFLRAKENKTMKMRDEIEWCLSAAECHHLKSLTSCARSASRGVTPSRDSHDKTSADAHLTKLT